MRTLLNGYLVVCEKPDKLDASKFLTVLAVSPEGNEGNQYVVWTQRLDDQTTFTGDYFGWFHQSKWQAFQQAYEAFRDR